MKMMRYVLVVCLSCAACGDPDVVATVGKTRVGRGEQQLYAQQRGLSYDDPAALDLLVARTLLSEAARRAGMESKSEVAARIAASRRELLAQAYLEQELRPATDEVALRRHYEATVAARKVKVVHVLHIVVRPKGDTVEQRQEARSRIGWLYAKLQDGGDFAELARTLSEDSASGAKGGDMGPLREGQVDSTFFEAAARLQAGELSAPVESPFGFHLLKAVEAPTEITPTFEESRGLLLSEVRSAAERVLMERLRSEISVRTYPERLVEKKQGDVRAAGESR